MKNKRREECIETVRHMGFCRGNAIFLIATKDFDGDSCEGELENNKFTAEDLLYMLKEGMRFKYRGKTTCIAGLDFQHREAELITIEITLGDGDIVYLKEFQENYGK